MRAHPPHASESPLGCLCGTCGARSATAHADESAVPRQRLEALLESANVLEGPTLGLLLPSGSLDVAGEAIARGLGALRGRRIRRVVLLASDPRVERAARVSGADRETSFGRLAGDTAAASLLAQYPGFEPSDADADVLGLRASSTLLRKMWPEAAVVSLQIGPAERGVLASMGQRLRQVLHEDTLLVACATLAHGSSSRFEALAAAVLARDSAPLWEADGGEVPCGREALEVFRAAMGPGQAAVPLAREVRGSAALVAAFPGRFPTVPALEREDRAALGAIVEQAIRAAVRGEPVPEVEGLAPRLRQRGGAFVTLTEGGRLLGCMGRLDGECLAMAAQQAARMAACGDPRFPSIREQALGRVEIEISVLGDFVRVEDPEEEFEPGRHGLLLTRGFDRGLLLPQVATHHGLDRRAFLETLARKAGLPPQAWREATLQRFGVEAFAPSPM